jgi:membrane peptidoglycan carboxypeptidase
MDRDGSARPRRWLRALRVGAVTGSLVLLALVVAAFVAYVRTDIPAPSVDATAGVTRMLYSDGAELGRVGGQHRIEVDLEQVPEDVREAVLAAEHREFYSDPGISLRGIARALLTNVRGGEIEQGGSTITQQYAKNAFLGNERTYRRKLQEVLIAVKMTRERSKDKVLEDYLNTVYFGRGAAGIEVASQTYFGKPVSALTPGEGAVLAASIRAPARYDPEVHPKAARERWQYVVDAMVEQGWVEPAAVQQPPAVLPIGAGPVNNDLTGPKGHVMTAVLDELEETGLQPAQLGGGRMEILTTVRRDAQEAAVAAVQARVGDGADPAGLQGALVSVEPGTGAVVAYYGGTNGTGFDFARQGGGNQPGSSFKPFVLAAALEKGISLDSTYDGRSPRRFPGGVEIDNFGGGSFGRVNLLEATRSSVNTVYYELGQVVGPEDVRRLAHRSGVAESSPLAEPDGFTSGMVALGAYEVSVMDQAAGFATFAAGGEAATPYLISEVRQAGETVYRAEVETERAFGEDVAADVTFALQAVVRDGTGKAARLAGGRPAAGKTGTTTDNRDVWFVGYTPQLSTAVWIGYGDNRPIRIGGREATGGGLAAGVWRRYTDAALAGAPVERFADRAGVGAPRDGRKSPSPLPRATRTNPPLEEPQQPSFVPLPPREEPADQAQAPPPPPQTREPSRRPEPTPLVPVPGLGNS